MVDASALAAAIMPLVALWVLWRLQAIAVDHALRPGMFQLLRYQRRTYKVVAWMGVLLHELSHAAFLLIGFHGIQRFKVGVDGGHIVPQQVRRGPYGTLTFLAAAMAPMFVAPAIVLAVVWLLLDTQLIQIAGAGVGWAAAWPVLRDLAVDLPVRLVRALVGIDLATWPGALVFLLAIFAMPAARPSYVKRGRKAEGDIVVFRRTVRKHPLLVAGVVLALVAAYFVLVPRHPAWYWAGWQIAWGIALVAIVLGALAGVGWYAVAWTGRIRAWAAWLPAAAAVLVQWQGRAFDMPMWAINLASLLAGAVLALGLLQVARRRH